MGEEFVRVGEGAAVGGVNFIFEDSSEVELCGDGGAEVDVTFAVWGAADGGFVAEKIVEGVEDFGADFEGVKTDARADGGDEIGVGRNRAEFFEGAGHDAGDDAAPAGVDSGHPPALLIGEEDRDAIGDANAGELVAPSDDDGVGVSVNIKLAIWISDGDSAAVDLVDAENAPSFDAYRLLEASIVFIDVGLRVLNRVCRVAEVEGVKRSGADAADSGCEGVRDRGGGEERGFVPDEIGFCASRQHIGRV